MKKFAVAWVDEFDHDLQLYLVEATDWRDALEKAKPGYVENVKDCETIEAAKQEAFNQEWNFNVIEIS